MKVSFDVPNSLASVLGFNRSIYCVGRHASGQLVNIMSVNSILVHCNIIHSSYMRGVQAPVVYNFFPNAAPGQKILEAPSNLGAGSTWRGIDYTFSSSGTLTCMYNIK